MKIKKLVAMLATAAMAVGLVAVAPTEAKAAEKETTIVVYVSDATKISGIYANIKDVKNGASMSAENKGTIPGWGCDGYSFTKDSNDNTKYTLKIKGDLAQGEATVELALVNKAGNNINDGLAIKLHKVADYATANTLYVSVDSTTNGTWAEISSNVSKTDPKAAKATDIIAKIDAIGTVEYSDACLEKITAAEAAYNAFTGNKADITNSSKIADAKAKYAELKAAAMGKVTVYVKNAEWSAVKGYTYPEKLGGFPGTALQADAKNAGWYVCSVDITDKTIFVFGDGKTQTEDLNIAAKGTYWLELSPKGTAEKYAVSSLSTTAPTGWVGSGNGGSGSTPTPTPTPTPEAPPTADVAPVVAMVAVAALAAVVVLKKRTVNE